MIRVPRKQRLHLSRSNRALEVPGEHSDERTFDEVGSRIVGHISISAEREASA